MKFIKVRSRCVRLAGMTAVFALAAAGIAALVLVRSLWGEVSAEQVLFHLTTPLAGGVDANLKRLILTAAAGVLAASLVFACFCRFCAARGERWASLVLALTVLVCAGLAEKDLGVTGFLLRRLQRTDIFDEVPLPSLTGVVFPGEKRSLLLIHMESMEETFNDAAVMGAPLLPELARLQRENVHFSGFRQTRGTEWTTAGMTASLMGLPLLLPIGKNDYGGYASFLPGAASLLDVLGENGYAMEFLFPNDCSFGGVRNMVATHAPGAAIKDLLWFREHRGDVEGNRGNSWGLRDRYLYGRLKEDLTLRMKRGGPCAFFVETIDTHGPDTYYFADPDVHAPERFHDFRDVLRASSLMASELIGWIQEQDFADRLTVVVLGDHLWMGDSVAGRPLGENRAVYNVFINPIPQPERGAPRVFCTPDFAPTILEAAGAKLPGRRFGIGTSLFSSRSTVIEELGEEKYNAELGKTSARYEQFFVRPDGREARESAPVNDFSRGVPSLAFAGPDLFLRRGGGRFRFVIDNGSGAALSVAEGKPPCFRASLLDSHGTALCENLFPLPCDIPPSGAEAAEGAVPLPPEDGDYTLRLELLAPDGSAVAAADAPAAVCSIWLWRDGPGGVAQSERAVLDGGEPVASFPGAMEVWYRGGTLFFKLSDDRIAPDEITLRGVPARVRELRRSGGDSFRWAAAPLERPPAGLFETGYRSGGALRRLSVSLLPALEDAGLRGEDDFTAYVGKLLRSDALILAAQNDGAGREFLLCAQGGKILTLQSGSPLPLHFDGEADGTYLDLNVYDEAAVAASPSGMRLSLRADGIEAAASQVGLNFAVYDPRRHVFADRAAFTFSGSLEDLGKLFSGGLDFSAWAASLPSGAARLIGRRQPDRGAPVARGSLLASWENGVIATLWRGRVYFQTPWELVPAITLLCGPEGSVRAFSPLDSAVSASFDGVISCLPESGNLQAAEIGFVSEAGERVCETADLTPLHLETDFCRYLRRLDDPGCAVFVSVLYEGAKRLTATHRALFAALGLDMSLEGTHGASYAAISDGGAKILEECRAERIDRTISAAGQTVRIVSTGADAGFESSITVNGEEYSARSLGMNIAVWDRKLGRVIDSVAFNTFSDLAASRKDARFRGKTP